MKSLPEVLTPDETVQALAVAHHDGAVGVLALTDRRVLFRAQGWGGQRLVSHALGEITDLRWTGGLGQGALTLFVAGWAVEFKNMDKRDGQSFADRLQQWRQWYAQQAGTASGPPGQAPSGQVHIPAQPFTAPAPAPGPAPASGPAPWGRTEPAAPAAQHPSQPSGGGGLFGRRRKEAEAEAARLGDALRVQTAETEALRAENQRLTAELTALAGADAARLVQETERLRRTHAEQLAEVGRIDAVLDAKVEAAAERAEGELRGTRQRLQDLEAQVQEAERRLSAARSGLVVTDDLALLQEAGIYEYRHPLADAVAYKAELARIKDRCKALTKDGQAVVGVTE